MNFPKAFRGTRQQADSQWYGLSESQQLKLTEILDQCIADFEAGKQVDESSVIGQNPDLAESLREHLASIRFLYEAGTGYRPDVTEQEVTGAPREIGGYRILREIGRGGMGVVYEAEDLSLLRRVALKVLPFAALLDQKQVARFRNEAQAAGQLHHPHIVPVYAVGCDRGVHFFAMQLVAGQPLDVAIAELRAAAASSSSMSALDGTAGMIAATDADTDPWHFDTKKASRTVEHSSPWRSFSTFGCHKSPEYQRNVATIGSHVAEALQQAHEVGILHRDIKPSNLMLDQSGKVWVTDFGLAHVPSDESMTMTGDVMGTVRYMSPEQAAGRTQFVDQRTDIYSLGITLYEMATLRRAFDTENREEFLARIAAEEPVTPRRLNRSIPLDLETIILKSMAKEPAQRYASAQEMAEDLRRFLEGRPTTARRPTLLDRFSKWTKRHRRLVTAATVLAVLSSIATGFAALQIANEQARTQAALVLSRAETLRANENFRQARNAVDELGMKTAQRLGTVPSTAHIRREILDRSQAYFREFIRQAGNESSLAADLAHAFASTAKISQLQYDAPSALAEYDQAIQIYESLLAATPDEPHCQAQLARCLCNRALVFWGQGKSQLAEVDLDRSLTIHRALQGVTGVDVEEARTDLAQALSNRAFIHTGLDQSKQARQCIVDAIELQRMLVDANPADDIAKQHLAVYLHNLAFQVSDVEPTLAQSACTEAIALQRALYEQRPGVLEFQRDLALSYSNLGSLQRRAQQYEPSVRSFQAAVDLGQKVADRAPGVVAHPVDLAVSINNLGRAFISVGQNQLASTEFRRSRRILEGLVELYGSTSEFEGMLGGVLFNQGVALLDAEGLDPAETAMSQGNRRLRRAMQLAPGNPGFVRDLDLQLKQYSRIMAMHKEFELAVAACWERAELWHAVPDKLTEVATEVESIVESAVNERSIDDQEPNLLEAWRQRATELRSQAAGSKGASA